MEFLYRAIDIQYAGSVDENGDPDGSRGPLLIKVEEWPVIRHTPKGVWVGWDDSNHFTSIGSTKKFICHTWRKKWAHSTKKEALESLIARREKQASIYEHRANHSREVALVAKDMILKNEDNRYIHGWEIYSLKLSKNSVIKP